MEIRNPTDLPDRLHFHQLAMRFLEIRFFGRERREIVIRGHSDTVPLISAPQVLGVLFWDNFQASLVSTASMGLIFLTTYLIGIAVAKRGRVTSV